MTPLAVCLILLLCFLTSMWTTPTTEGGTPMTRGGRPPSLPTVRGIRLSNQGPDAITFSKIGLYTSMADAKGDRSRDWLEQNQSSLQFYTNGLVVIKGDAIDMSHMTSFERVSDDHYVTLTKNTSLVIDLNDDVPITVVRMGAVESTTAPDQRRLLVETSTNYTKITDATFTPGFVRWLDGQSSGSVPAMSSLSASAPASHIDPSGIYEYASAPTGFVSLAAVQFALPSLARQVARQIARGQPAPAYGQATLANGTSGFFYPYYPAGDFTGPYYCYLGAVDQGGQRVLHPNQAPGSPFVQAGLVPASIYVPPGFWVADFPGKNGFFASSGFPIDRVMQGDFTLVIKSDGTYPMCSFAWRSTPFDPRLACSFNNYDRAHWIVWGPPWGWDGKISGPVLTTAGHYISNENGRHIETDPLTWYWYRYQRSGNNLRVSYGPSLGYYAYTPVSATCATGDYVGCLLGAAGGRGTSHEIVSFTGKPHVSATS